MGDGVARLGRILVQWLGLSLITALTLAASSGIVARTLAALSAVPVAESLHVPAFLAACAIATMPLLVAWSVARLLASRRFAGFQVDGRVLLAALWALLLCAGWLSLAVFVPPEDPGPVDIGGSLLLLVILISFVVAPVLAAIELAVAHRRRRMSASNKRFQRTAEAVR